MFFDGFTLERRSVSAGQLRLRRGGSGPPLLLLHGNPQTHAMWHAVAPALAERFTVVCPDLRGYGGSFKPAATADHAPLSKRPMATDMIELMADLGHDRFDLVGHDRGARVAHRLALDHPKSVTRLALLDIVPTLAHFERTDMAFALGYYHWFWLAQPHPFPETLIAAQPQTWFRGHTGREPKADDFFHPEAEADYLAALHDPATIRGICEDYRAAASIDLEHDRASRAAGEMITAPLLVLWGAKGKIGEWYDPLAIWRGYAAAALTGQAIPSGHYLAEAAPRAVLTAFEAFFAGPALDHPSCEIEGPLKGQADLCAPILEGLPDWFGIETARLDYLRQVDEQPTYLARLDGNLIGFLTVKSHFAATAELLVIGVSQRHHRRGIGHMLLQRTEADLRARGCRYLQVKTLAASNSDENYARTRRFYGAMGFEPLEELTTLWGPDNPCLVMIKAL